MTLKPYASYPQARAYVLTLHSDAAPSEGRFIGRLEHLVSGRQFHFTTAAELIACLVRTEPAEGARAAASYAEVPQ